MKRLLLAFLAVLACTCLNAISNPALPKSVTLGLHQYKVIEADPPDTKKIGQIFYDEYADKKLRSTIYISPDQNCVDKRSTYLHELMHLAARYDVHGVVDLRPWPANPEDAIERIEDNLARILVENPKTAEYLSTPCRDI